VEEGHSLRLLSQYTENIDSLMRFEFMKNILGGIHKSCSENQDTSMRLSAEHFKTVDRRVIVNDDVSAYVFTSIAPKAFAKIRESQGISERQYLESLNAEQIQEKFNDNSFSTGKSGSFFWISRDKKLAIKTIERHELITLKDRTERYYQYIHTSPHSLITKFYGIYSIQMPNTKKIRFVVMDFLFGNQKIQAKYDIKGSWVNRRSNKNASLLMDLDLKQKICLPSRVAKNLLQQLERDVEFLKSVGIMDYSLLIGIHDSLREDTHTPSSSRIFKPTQDRGIVSIHDEIFYLGIIDVTQTFNFNKRMERFAKVFCLRKDRHGISAIDPDKYAKRFMKRMREIIEEE